MINIGADKYIMRWLLILHTKFIIIIYIYGFRQHYVVAWTVHIYGFIVMKPVILNVREQITLKNWLYVDNL